jgi:hypothetical protein
MKNRRNGCLIALLALCGVVLILAWRVWTPPRISNDVSFSQLSPEQQQERRTEAKQFEQQVEDVIASGRRRERKPFTIRATARVLNTLLQDRMQAEKFPINNVIVGIAPHRLAIQGNIELKRISGPATLTGDVVLENNQLVYKAESLQFRGFSVNQYKDRIEREVSKRLNELLKQTPGQLNRVEVEQDALVIEGVTD